MSLFVLLSCLLFSCGPAQKRLLTYNIRNGKGMDNVTDYDRIAAVIRNSKADIVALQELDSMTKRNPVYLLQTLANKTHMHSYFAHAITYQGGAYGPGILTKHKPERMYTIALPGKEEERALAVAVFEKYVVFCTHLSLTAADRIRSADIINAEAAKYDKPVYLLGDLNATPESEIILLLKKQWSLLSGEANTFPADVPDRCIDYIFVRNARVRVKKAEVIDEPKASDHRPVLVLIKN